MYTDLKYAFRQLAKNPGFALFSVLTLALGIGANTAIFSAVNTVLLSVLPVKNPKELVFLSNPDNLGFGIGNFGGDTRAIFTYPEFQYLRDHNEVFSGLLAVNTFPKRADVTVADEGLPARSGRASVSLVSGDYFSVLGVNPILGRAFGPEVDKVRDANPVAVISYQIWQGRFGADPKTIGRKVRINDTIFDIIGVAPPGFLGETVGSSPAVWVPMSMQEEIIPGSDYLSPETNPLRKTVWLQIVGRLKPGVSAAQATASINVTFRQYLEGQVHDGVPENRVKEFLNEPIVLTPGSHGASTLRRGYAEPLAMLMTLVGLLLLIACANLANLLLARATSRQKEIAVRAAMGAKPGRIFRQLLTESLLLSAIGGAVSLLFAHWGDLLLVQLAGPSLVLNFDWRTLIFAFGASIFVGVLFGVTPALQAARVDLNLALKGSSGSQAKSGGLSAGRILVVGQVSLSILLLMVAGLFMHSFQKLASLDLGYEQDHLLLFDIDLGASGFKGPAAMQLFQSLAARITAIPGVRSATYSLDGLFTGADISSEISIESYAPTSAQSMSVQGDTIGSDYFTTVGIPILLGRELQAQDEMTGQRVGVINQTMARYYFGNANPLGRRIRIMDPTNPSDFLIVGIAADAKYNSAKETTPRRYYTPFSPTDDMKSLNFEVRAAGNPATVITSIRAAVKQVVPNLPTVGIQTMNERMDQTLGLDLLLTKLSSLFGALATLLASVGIYGIMSYSVARRTKEIGIRMALGARRENVLWLILGETLKLALIGILVGVPVALGAGRLIAGLLFGLAAVDPLVLGVTVVLLSVVAVVAGYVPAWRAARVDPLVALRTE